MQEKPKTHSTGLQKSNNQQVVENTQLDSLSKNIVKHLLNCMEEITDTRVTPANVNAACNCAKQIHNLMKLKFDMSKRGLT